MAKTRTRSEIVSTVKKYATELERLGLPVDRIILFGSYSRNLARDESDIDLAVFSKSFGPPRHLEFSGILSKATWHTEPMIEAIGFHPSRLKKPDRFSFVSEIVRTGKVIYRRSKKRDK